MVLPGPLGTWRVTVIVAPVTGTVCTMLSIPAPLMVKRMRVTVEGIAAASGRGVERDETAALAAEDPAPPIVTVTAVVPPPVTAEPVHPASAAARRIPASARAVRTVIFPGSVVFIDPPLSGTDSYCNSDDATILSIFQVVFPWERGRVKTAPAGRGDPVPAGVRLQRVKST